MKTLAWEDGMKVLVVYDSVHGNTETIAKAIAGAIAGEVKLVHARDAAPAILEDIDLIIAGAPTHGGQATPEMQQFLAALKKEDVKGKKAASFDTRLSAKWVTIFGYAAGRIGKKLKELGADLLVNPEPFFVTATKGPLKDGEEARAAAWAKNIISKNG